MPRRLAAGTPANWPVGRIGNRRTDRIDRGAIRQRPVALFILPLLHGARAGLSAVAAHSRGLGGGGWLFGADGKDAQGAIRLFGPALRTGDRLGIVQALVQVVKLCMTRPAGVFVNRHGGNACVSVAFYGRVVGGVEAAGCVAGVARGLALGAVVGMPGAVVGPAWVASSVEGWVAGGAR